MGHVKDRWTVPGPSGRRVKGPRYGRGKRWLARWVEPDGGERAKAFPTRDAAQAHIDRVEVDKRGGVYITASSLTFEQYAKAWMPRQAHAPSTAAQVESRMRLHVFPVIGHYRLDQVTRVMVQDLVVGSSLGPAARKVLYSYVSAVFSSAVEDRLIAVSPCRRIRLPAPPPRTLAPLSVEEVAAIAQGVPKHLAAMVWVGAGSGLRPGELRSLTVDRVVGGVLVVDRALTDATRAGRPAWGPLKRPGSVRRVPLAAVTREVLEKHLAGTAPGPEGLVFTSARGAPLRRSQLQYAWKAAGGRGAGWHELRHHHASLLVAAGMSPRAVADRLGHADPSETLRTYAHLWATDEVRLLAAIEAAHDPSGSALTDQ